MLTGVDEMSVTRSQQGGPTDDQQSRGEDDISARLVTRRRDERDLSSQMGGQTRRGEAMEIRHSWCNFYKLCPELGPGHL